MVENQNWTSEFQLAFKNISDLYSFLGWELTPSLTKVAETYPLFVPRNLALKIKAEGPDGILAKEFLPADQELNPEGLVDPIGDKEFFKAPQLIHRYKTRALFTPTSVCPVHCRYCFRKNELNAADELFQRDFEETLNYLRSHPEISEIIFTGGDPLTLSNERLENILKAFSEISSLKDIRFHSRYPVILPERLDAGLVKLFSDFAKKFRTLTLAIHVNHSHELDVVNKQKIRSLHETGIQLLSQTVLLKDVNDSANTLITLFDELLNLKVRPYYLHHPDRVKGGMHFYLPLEEGRKIYAGLRDELPGWALPHYVIDIPGGHGKVSAFNPESHEYSGTLLAKDGYSVDIPEFVLLS